MKKIILSGCIAFTMMANAQTNQGSASVVSDKNMKEGTVVYERTIQMNFTPPPNSNIDMSNFPKSRKDKFELKFNSSHTLWEALPSMEENANEISGGSGGNRMIMRFAGGDELIYHNFETAKRIEQRELNAKNYLIEDSIRKLSWRLSDETQMINGYKAQKATAQRIGTRTSMSMENGEMKRQEVADTVAIVAWFTTEIPVPAGPEFQGQLPGLILELNMNNGRTVYKAIEISPKVKVSDIKEPKKGKKISAADFALERQKMLEEMRKNMPSNGSFRVSTN